jgi:hypothetical protein
LIGIKPQSSTETLDIISETSPKLLESVLETDELQSAIAAELQVVLEKCSYKINQRLLLRDLFATNIASPFLLAPVAPPGGVASTLLTSTAPNNSNSSSINSNSGSSNANPNPSPSSTALTGTPQTKLKSNIFNNNIAPRKRPPIPPSSTTITKTDGIATTGDTAQSPLQPFKGSTQGIPLADFAKV